MPTSTAKSAFYQGMAAGTPFLLVAAPFAMLFGILAAEAGLNIVQILAFTALVIAGASQFTAVQLINEAAPVWIVVATALAVNLRMAMYSASLQPYLGAAPLWQRVLVSYLNFDVSYAMGIQKYEDTPEMSVRARVAYFVGTVFFIVPVWFLGTYVGAVAGDALPENLSLEFAMPILFLALVGPMVKTLAHLAAAITSVVAALALSFLPSGIDLLLAALLAMMVGAEMERRRDA